MLIIRLRECKFLLLAVLLVLTACGGGDTAPATPTEVTGTVNAPSGDIAMYQNKSMYAKAMDWFIPSAEALIQGLAPVGGATVELIEIDADGNQVGAVIDSTTTAADGSFTLETTRSLGTNLVIRVGSTTGTAAEIRAFVTADTVTIDPTSELVVGSVISTIASISGAELSHFTAQEISDLAALVDALNLDLAMMTIANALAAIDAAAGESFDQAVSGSITTDFSGLWDYTDTVTSTTCPGIIDVGDVDTGTVSVTQDGINITITGDGIVSDGTVVDNIVTWAVTDGSYSESGTVTITGNGTIANGTNTWTDSDGNITCTVTNSISATRVPT